MLKITSARSQPLFNVAATRRIEQLAASQLPPHTLMQRAGLAVARLALALTPHASCIWVACGPGNNGGDGFEAAMHLHSWGKRVVVTWTGAGIHGLPPDAEAAKARALAAGVAFVDQPPVDFDLCIDALLGIGANLDPSRDGSARMLSWLQVMHDSERPCLAVDIPSGLNADTGLLNADVGLLRATNSKARDPMKAPSQRRFTLSLLTLKPGLFTCDGRDSAGQVWFADLGVQGVSGSTHPPPDAWLLGADRAAALPRSHVRQASHKGSFGDVAIIGGESTSESHMAGAALLAARAALTTGAGRVFVALLTGDKATGLQVDVVQPELMFRSLKALDIRQQAVVCGCGGGTSMHGVLHTVLSTAKSLVLDADALNAIANDLQLQALLTARHHRELDTVLTPHPLEAARLLGSSVDQVQANRFQAANQLASRFKCVAVLKGSGTVVAAPGQPMMINGSGNALLATAGTGDVLAGMLGAFIAQIARTSTDTKQAVFDATCGAVFEHGRLADDWLIARPGVGLVASALASHIGESLRTLQRDAS